MAIQDKNTLKTYFETGDLPSQNQFVDLIDSLKHENDTSFVELSDREIIIMTNRLAAMNKAFIEYYSNADGSIVTLDVISENTENQTIEITQTKDQTLKQYFIGDAPYVIRLKESQEEKLGLNEYYKIDWQLNQNYNMQRLFGNNLPDLPKDFEFGEVVDGNRFYLQILKQNYGQKIDIVNTNIQFVNKTDIAIEYRIESNYWGDTYKKEDTVTDHYDIWDYLYFRYKADMTNETDTVVCNIYDLDTKKLITTTYLDPGQNYTEASGGSVNQLRNVLIECTRK